MRVTLEQSTDTRVQLTVLHEHQGCLRSERCDLEAEADAFDVAARAARIIATTGYQGDLYVQPLSIARNLVIFRTKGGYDTTLAIEVAKTLITEEPESPDKYCVTLENGECVSTDPRCIHQSKATEFNVEQATAGLPDPPLPERQWLGVYVSSDEDAQMLLKCLAKLKVGERIALVPGHGISSLDWDNFEPSSEEDEAWRNDAYERDGRSA